MTENDKILINAYLDGEASEDEIKYVEKLINANPNDNEYANRIKKANLEINSYFNSQEIKDLDLDLSSFIENIKSSKESINMFNLLSNYLFSQRFLSLSLATALFLSVGVNINNFYNLTNNKEKLYVSFGLEEFSDKNIKFEYLSTKSNSLIDSDEVITKSLEKIIENKSLTSTVNYGNKIYKLTLNDKIIDDYNIECYAGTLISDDKKEFIFCNNNNILSISYK